MSPGKSLPQLMQERRLALGMSLAEVARMARLPESSVTAYERGDRSPKLPAVAAIAKALQTTIQDIDPWWEDRAGAAVVSEPGAEYEPKYPCPREIRALCQEWDSLDEGTRKSITDFVEFARQRALKSPKTRADSRGVHSA